MQAFKAGNFLKIFLGFWGFWGSCFHEKFFHCVKSVRIRSFSGPYFPAFELNTEKYFEHIFHHYAHAWKRLNYFVVLVEQIWLTENKVFTKQHEKKMNTRFYNCIKKFLLDILIKLQTGRFMKIKTPKMQDFHVATINPFKEQYLIKLYYYVCRKTLHNLLNLLHKRGHSLYHGDTISPCFCHLLL